MKSAKSTTETSIAGLKVILAGITDPVTKEFYEDQISMLDDEIEEINDQIALEKEKNKKQT